MANFNLNKVILGGRLASVPELKQTQGGQAVTSFSLAVTRRYSGKDEQQKADFINCVAWRQTAEFVNKYFTKGSAICIEGELQTRDYLDKNSQKRYVTEVNVQQAYFVDSKADAAAVNAPPPQSYAYQPSPQTAAAPTGQPIQAPQFEVLSDEDVLPF